VHREPDQRHETLDAVRQDCLLAVELKGKIKLASPASYTQAAILVAMTGTITTRGP
jgi:hypothetical protein